MRTVIVPLDGSPTAERAIEPARAFAARSGANLMLLTVADDPHHGWARPYLEERATALMEGDQAPGGRMPTVETEVVAGWSPADSIVRIASETPDAVVCMSTRGHNGLSTAVLGSVADDVVRAAAGPVLLVGPDNELGAGLRDPAHVVVCIDESDLSHGVVDPAVEVALELRAEITVVRVLEPILALVPGPLPSEPTEPEIPALEAVAKEVANRGVPAAYALLRPDNAATAIVRFARDETGTACIALATRARTGFARAVLGSVAQRVVRHAPCPVLVYHPGGSDEVRSS
jgi:nucleotide-binding universal stress UspA family protein